MRNLNRKCQLKRVKEPDHNKLLTVNSCKFDLLQIIFFNKVCL